MSQDKGPTLGFFGADPADPFSLRDFFAAHAPAIPPEVIRADPWTGAGHLQCLNVIEKEIWWRWHYADKMIAARKIASE